MHNKKKKQPLAVCRKCNNEFPVRSSIVSHLNWEPKDPACKLCSTITQTLKASIEHKTLPLTSINSLLTIARESKEPEQDEEHFSRFLGLLTSNCQLYTPRFLDPSEITELEKIFALKEKFGDWWKNYNEKMMASDWQYPILHKLRQLRSKSTEKLEQLKKEKDESRLEFQIQQRELERGERYANLKDKRIGAQKAIKGMTQKMKKSDALREKLAPRLEAKMRELEELEDKIRKVKTENEQFLRLKAAKKAEKDFLNNIGLDELEAKLVEVRKAQGIYGAKKGVCLEKLSASFVQQIANELEKGDTEKGEGRYVVLENVTFRNLCLPEFVTGICFHHFFSNLLLVR